MTSYAVTITWVRPLKGYTLESRTTVLTYTLAQQLVDTVKTRSDFVSAHIKKEYK